MTVVSLLPKASEPPEKKPLEDGANDAPKELEQLESGYQRRPPTSRKLNFYLIQLSSYPIYAFIFFFFMFDQCLQMFDHIHIILFLGFMTSFEFLNVILFTPPKNSKDVDFVVVEYTELTELEFIMKKVSKEQYLHAFCTMISTWLFVDIVIVYVCKTVDSDFYILVAMVVFALATFVTFKIYRALREKYWMEHICKNTMIFSIVTQLLGCMCLVSTIYNPEQEFALLFLGSFTLLVAVANLRFNYNYENPPKTKCMLTIPHIRSTLDVWWNWLAILNGAIWAALLLVILLPSSSPYAVPRSQCIQDTSMILMSICIFVPTMFMMTIVASCIFCCARRKVLNFQN